MTLEINRLYSAYQKATQSLLNERIADGHWVGQLSTSALSTATAVSALSAFAKNSNDHSLHKAIIDRAVEWLISNQNDDGGWGDTQKSYSNIATTMLVIAALHFCGRQAEFSALIESGNRYVDLKGGIDGLRKRYGKDKTFAVPILANCAMAGTVNWKHVAALPFEAACVPQKFYHMMQLPVVSYAIPALVAIGQTKFYHDPPWNPLTRILRKWSVGRSLRLLEKMQPASGGFLEAIPLTSFVVMGLSTSGRSDNTVVQNGIRFILDSVLDDGSWPIDTNLATWTTTLSVNALNVRTKTKLAADPVARNIVESNSNTTETIERSGGTDEQTAVAYDDDISQLKCLDWILSCQNKQVHPFTNSPPGGWGWTNLSGAVPDADDTPGAMLSIAKMHACGNVTQAKQSEIESAAISGVDWLLKLQNRDHGWPTFCRGWGKLPFDRSGSDITAHCLRGIHAWRDLYPDQKRLNRAIDRGVRYLTKNQRSDGSWLPLWFGNQDHPEEENPVYGTAKVLAAFFELNLLDTPAAQSGMNCLKKSQNRDGSWGGGISTAKSIQFEAAKNRKRTVSGSVEETALAVEALLFEEKSLVNSGSNREQIENGLKWLIEAVETDCFQIDWPIGFYFAKLWYHERLYPQIFTVAALGRAVGLIEGNRENQ